MNPSARRAHRKRISAFRLSSDTTATLPEYNNIHSWQRQQDNNDDPPSDQPPDYPDSAEEADEETDSDVKPPIISPPLSPFAARRSRRLLVHKRRQSNPSSDHFLDSLLERSVHALEMSNALLQSSISTQTDLPGVLAADSTTEHSLQARARGLPSTVRTNRDVYDHWADDLDQINQDVDRLFGGQEDKRTPPKTSISSSLPTTGLSIQPRRPRKRPSLDLQVSSPESPGLHLSTADRGHLVSPPPRALTQFVASSADPDSIILPSTIGLRSSGSSHFSGTADSRRIDPSTHSTLYPNLHSLISLPVVTDRTSGPSTPAYNMLSSFVARPPSSGSTTPAPSTLSAMISRTRRGSSGTTTSAERRKSRSILKDSGPSVSNPSRSRSPAATRTDPLRQCPPIKEQSPSPSPSSSSDDGCPAKLTIQSLRKILDDQPPLLSETAAGKRPAVRDRLRPPAFLPRTPPPPPAFGTSTATASISRLYTKGTHSSSTRPPPPPKSSAMKQASRSRSPTPNSIPNPTTMRIPNAAAMSLPDLLGMGVARALVGGASRSSSGRSTPKRISFAELPESYASSRPAASSSSKKKSRSGRKGRRKGSESDGGGGEGGGGGSGWWTAWLVSAASGIRIGTKPVVPSVLRQETTAEERVEERVGWGSRMGFSSGLNDWAV